MGPRDDQGRRRVQAPTQLGGEDRQRYASLQARQAPHQGGRPRRPRLPEAGQAAVLGGRVSIRKPVRPRQPLRRCQRPGIQQRTRRRTRRSARRALQGELHAGPLRRRRRRTGGGGGRGGSRRRGEADSTFRRSTPVVARRKAATSPAHFSSVASGLRTPPRKSARGRGRLRPTPGVDEEGGTAPPAPHRPYLGKGGAKAAFALHRGGGMPHPQRHVPRARAPRLRAGQPAGKHGTSQDRTGRLRRPRELGVARNYIPFFNNSLRGSTK